MSTIRLTSTCNELKYVATLDDDAPTHKRTIDTNNRQYNISMSRASRISNNKGKRTPVVVARHTCPLPTLSDSHTHTLHATHSRWYMCGLPCIASRLHNSIAAKNFRRHNISTVQMWEYIIILYSMWNLSVLVRAGPPILIWNYNTICWIAISVDTFSYSNFDGFVWHRHNVLAVWCTIITRKPLFRLRVWMRVMPQNGANPNIHRTEFARVVRIPCGYKRCALNRSLACVGFVLVCACAFGACYRWNLNTEEYVQCLAHGQQGKSLRFS